MPRLRDILVQRTLFSVEQGQSVIEVARAMAEFNVGAILVLEKGELRGLFSERDLLNRVVVAGVDPAATPVDAVMTSELTSIQDVATTEQAMELMRRNNCRHLPVLRGRRVVGLLSMRDLMNYELEHKTQLIDRMREPAQDG